MRRVRNMNRIRLKIYECISKYMKWNWVFMAWLLTKHTLLSWIHFGTDTLVTPALTFEYADCECYGRYSSYGEGFHIYDGNHDGRWWPSKIRL